MDKISEIINKVVDKHVGRPFTNGMILNGIFEAISGRTLSSDEALSILFGVGVDSWDRFDVFLRLVPHLTDSADYWCVLRSAYTNSDNLYRLKEDVRACFGSDRPERNNLMTPDEIDFLSGMPDVLTIHRGMTTKEANSDVYGISWTLDYERAEFFAYEYMRNRDTNRQEKTIVSLEVPKCEIVAYFSSRNEDEIIHLN